MINLHDTMEHVRGITVVDNLGQEVSSHKLVKVGDIFGIAQHNLLSDNQIFGQLEPIDEKTKTKALKKWTPLSYEYLADLTMNGMGMSKADSSNVIREIKRRIAKADTEDLDYIGIPVGPNIHEFSYIIIYIRKNIDKMFAPM